MSDFTNLLQQWDKDDAEVQEALFSEIYAELSLIAKRQLSKELGKRDLQPAELVNEAYLRMVDINRTSVESRTQFLAIAAKIMKNILIDHARRRNAKKRDGGVQLSLTDWAPGSLDPTTNMIALHAALEKLAAIDPDRARIVELRFFGGLTIEEVAQLMNIATVTVKRSWRVAKAYLYKQLVNN